MDRKNRMKMTVVMMYILATLLVAIGISLAWLVHKNSMITLAPVIRPGNISITGPNGTAIESLDLSYTDDCVSTDANGNKRVTVTRDICVKSTEDYYELEIAHTTNMKGLKFALYLASDQNTSLEGTYLNIANKINDQNGTYNYHYADNTKHEKNFGEYVSVQKHAEPVYWKVNSALSSNKNQIIKESLAGEDITYYLTDYRLSVTWIEENKETDMFYILARNVENNSQNN